VERLPTRRDLERLAAWADLHRADTVLRAELSRRLEAEAQTTLLEHEAVHRLVIAPGRRLTMYQLADALLVSRSGATRLIDRLEGRGWVARRIAPHDRRIVRAELTREGAAAFARIGSVFAAAFEARFGGVLDDEDVAALRRVLAKLSAASPGASAG
jgi:DNA-binding MarR family transcriptional regulator